MLKGQHLSFEATPDYADLSNILSRLHYPIIGYIDAYLKPRALKELSTLVIKEPVNQNIKNFAHYLLARRIVMTKIQIMKF